MSSLAETASADSGYAAFAPGHPVATSEPRKPALPMGRISAAAAIIALAGAGIGAALYRSAGFETTNDAYLEGHVHAVSPRINGTVIRVLVDDNARVEPGQPLFEIDPADLSLAVQAAEADLAQARANAEQAKAQAARARAEVAAASARIAQNAAELKRAQLDFRRMESLAEENVRAVSTQEVDASRAAYDSAQAARSTLIAERDSADAALDASRAQNSAASALIQKAAAALSAARLQVDYTVVRSPSAGRVAKKNVEVGQRLQPGQPVMAVVDDRIWVVANFKEGQLSRMRVGERAAVTVDAADGRVFTGVVDSFSPGTGAEFSLLPPDNSTGNFTKVVQRVPVKILFAPDSLGADAARLYPGLSAVVRVSIRN